LDGFYYSNAASPTSAVVSAASKIDSRLSIQDARKLRKNLGAKETIENARHSKRKYLVAMDKIVGDREEQLAHGQRDSRQTG